MEFILREKRERNDMEVRKCLYCIPYFLNRITNCKVVSENNAKPFCVWNLSRLAF